MTTRTPAGTAGIRELSVSRVVPFDERSTTTAAVVLDV
jgi:hypothetical protein